MSQNGKQTNSDNGNEDKHFDFSIHLLKLFLIGIALSVPELIKDYILQFVAANHDWLKIVLTKIIRFCSFMSLVLIVCSAVLFSMKTIIHFIWNTLFNKVFKLFYDSVNGHLNIVSGKINAISTEAHSLAADVRDNLIKQQKPLTLETCSTLSDYEQIMIPPCKEIFGKHIDNPKSLFRFVRTVYLDSFSKRPHPSDVKKTIDVRKRQGDEEYVDWHDKTTYKIHHVDYNSTEEPGEYLLKFKTTSFGPDIEPKDWVKKLSLKVYVDNVPILKPEDMQYEKETHKDGLYCWKNGNWIEVRFQERISLKKEWTEVDCEERSVNSVIDKNYILNSDKPICGYTLNVNLPEEFIFIKSPFISPKIIYSGLPNHISTHVPRCIEVEYGRNDNSIRVYMNEWVMPGIILSLNWIDKP